MPNDDAASIAEKLGKVRLYQVLAQFTTVWRGVAAVIDAGYAKHVEPRRKEAIDAGLTPEEAATAFPNAGWQRWPEEGYKDAFLRHQLEVAEDKLYSDLGILECLHVAWNALALAWFEVVHRGTPIYGKPHQTRKQFTAEAESGVKISTETVVRTETTSEKGWPTIRPEFIEQTRRSINRRLEADIAEAARAPDGPPLVPAERATGAWAYRG